MPVVPAAVIWDMDGVLVDSTDVHYEALRRMALARGRELSRAQFLSGFGMRSVDALRVLFGDLSDDEARRLAEATEAEFRSLAEGKLRPLPGAEHLVRALHQAQHPQALASSAPHENVELVLRELGLTGCFQAVVTGDDVRHGKPDPEAFLLAAARLGAPPAHGIVLEDSPVGIEAARKAGMRAIGVATTRRRSALADADRIVDSLDRLAPGDFWVAV